MTLEKTSSSYVNCYKNSKASVTRSIDIDFSLMEENDAQVSDINAGIEVSKIENELFPAHMRVYFLFKCD